MSELDIGVLSLASRDEQAWRPALIRAAQAESVAYTEMRWTHPEYPGWMPPPRSILFADDLTRGPWIAPAHWFVLPVDAGELFAELEQRMPAAPRSDLLRQASRHLAMMTHYIEQGAKLVPRDSGGIDIRGLGYIQRDPIPLNHQHILSPPELNIYSAGPALIGASANWPISSLFYTKGQERTGGDQLIDLTGRARILTHGPYIMLPPGCWRASLLFEVDCEGGGIFLRFDWGSVVSCETESFSIAESGCFRLVLEHQWHEPAEAELRVWASRAMFQGRLQLMDIQISRVG